jgi:cytochrome P450
LAGYETTSTILGYISYVLAKYPEEQKKVLKEIIEHFPFGSKVRDKRCSKTIKSF